MESLPGFLAAYFSHKWDD
ncbi:protein MgtS [Escherichia coli]|nr:protein MgtS [Escherichia coli]